MKLLFALVLSLMAILQNGTTNAFVPTHPSMIKSYFRHEVPSSHPGGVTPEHTSTLLGMAKEHDDGESLPTIGDQYLGEPHDLLFTKYLTTRYKGTTWKLTIGMQNTKNIFPFN